MYQSKLVINEDFSVMFYSPRPNLWHRFWYRVLLGWSWKEVEAEEEYDTCSDCTCAPDYSDMDTTFEDVGVIYLQEEYNDICKAVDEHLERMRDRGL